MRITTLVSLALPILKTYARETSLFINPPALPDLPSPGQASLAEGLNLTNIQGDVLVGMKKNKELFFFLNIVNGTQFKITMRTTILPIVTTVNDLLSVSTQPTTALNIAFSHDGMVALGINDDLGDDLFQVGQAARADQLGDPGTANWVPGLSHVHAMIILASDTDANIDLKLTEIQSAFGSSINEVHRLRGAARPGSEEGHEHFGFMDGISQPAINGFTTNVVPGQASIPPGIILLGREGDSLSASRPAWTIDGSFLVFRQLKQLVPEFNKYLTDNALTDGGLTVQQGADLLGARMVGRWKSGAPIDLSPTSDNTALATNPDLNNNFDFSDPVTGSTDDQTRCPFSAHVRKTNPRADLPSQFVDPHRIIRGGIPYGPEVTASEAASQTTSIERGLAFVCYQSSIAQGFHFLQQSWANNVNFLGHASDPTPGFDPIIGANQANPRAFTGMVASDPTRELRMVTDFVVSRGGEHFFSPSVSAIKDIFTA